LLVKKDYDSARKIAEEMISIAAKSDDMLEEDYELGRYVSKGFNLLIDSQENRIKAGTGTNLPAGLQRGVKTPV